MNNLYVIGGQQRSLRSLRTGNQNWNGYQKGLILQVNPETCETNVCVDYVSPPEVCAEEEPAIMFQASTIENQKLYLCTQTEVLIYTLPTFERIGYISLPCFNDVHHVRPTPDGNLLVANAGLEMILEITVAGEVRRAWNVLGEDPWGRFSRDTDYRRLSTKPHRSHPNYIFYVDEEVWVTRFQQGDVFCLTNPAKRIQISAERIHDGVLHEGMIYCTTVNGNIVIANPNTLQVEEVIDLNSMHTAGTLLGWCRSIMIDGGRAWVGFSRIRPTKIRENLSWVMRGFRRVLPAHVACYDLIRLQCVAEVHLESAGLSAIFSIFPAQT
jgi:hypothetical protein